MIHSLLITSKKKIIGMELPVVEDFYNRHGEAYLLFACHAALPLGLNPEIVYSLWANFRMDCQGKSLEIPWIATSDLLLSNLCEEVGAGLYEMDHLVRTELLDILERNTCFGLKRIQELAVFLSSYIQPQLKSDNLDIRDFSQAQNWVSIAYLRPEKAARRLTSLLANAFEEKSDDLLRLASIVKALEKPLANYPNLLTYARGMAKYAQGDIEEAQQEFSQIEHFDKFSDVPGNTLPLPQIQKTQTEFKTYQRQLKFSPIERGAISLTFGILCSGTFLIFKSYLFPNTILADAEYFPIHKKPLESLISLIQLDELQPEEIIEQDTIEDGNLEIKRSTTLRNLGNLPDNISENQSIDSKTNSSTPSNLPSTDDINPQNETNITSIDSNSLSSNTSANQNTEGNNSSVASESSQVAISLPSSNPATSDSGHASPEVSSETSSNNSGESDSEASTDNFSNNTQLYPGLIDRIMGDGILSEEQMETFLTSNNEDALRLFPDLPKIYREEANIEGINYDIAFSQMLIETSFLRFVNSDNNFGGVGEPGTSFPSTRAGVRAHIQHLKAYASKESLVQELIDPRFRFVNRGSAVLVDQLSGRWSVDPLYGSKILALVNRMYESAGLLNTARLESVAINQIEGNGYLSERQMIIFLQEKNGGAIRDWPDLPKIYRQEAATEGINYDIAFAQMLVETSFLRFGDGVKASQNNFASIGAIDENAPRTAFFPNARLGVRAHIQHLKAYANQEPLVQELIDPQFRFVSRGSAPLIDQLSGRWSADPLYGDKVMSVLIEMYESAGLL